MDFFQALQTGVVVVIYWEGAQTDDSVLEAGGRGVFTILSTLEKVGGKEGNNTPREKRILRAPLQK